MANIDQSVCDILGVTPVDSGVVEVPLYIRRRMSLVPGSQFPVYRAQSLCLSQQFLAGIILQITDLTKFRG
jgi:hypothetical protein